MVRKDVQEAKNVQTARGREKEAGDFNDYLHNTGKNQKLKAIERTNNTTIGRYRGWGAMGYSVGLGGMGSEHEKGG